MIPRTLRLFSLRGANGKDPISTMLGICVGLRVWGFGFMPRMLRQADAEAKPPDAQAQRVGVVVPGFW